jgi:hypothetical protein
LEEYRHIVATWEMIASLEWLMRFKPYEHRGHKRFFKGRLINFDSTLFPQFSTDPGEVGINKEHGQDELLHFNFVISIYRLFCKVPWTVRRQVFQAAADSLADRCLG